MLTIFASVIFFHILVLLGIIPYDIVWGGNLKSKSEMYIFETISLSTIFLFLLFSLIQAELVNIKISKLFTKIVLWFMLIVFSLNTIGNLLAESTLETVIFTPLTAITAVFAFILLFIKENQVKNS